MRLVLNVAVTNLWHRRSQPPVVPAWADALGRGWPEEGVTRGGDGPERG